MKLDKQFIILSSSSVLLLALVACSSIGPVLLYISGLLVSALLGISGYLALRLKFSSPFKSIPKFPEQASNFQRSLFESISAANGSQEKESGVHQLGASSLPTPSPYIRDHSQYKWRHSCCPHSSNFLTGIITTFGENTNISMMQGYFYSYKYPWHGVVSTFEPT